jgi:hypothetical protein
MIVCGRLFMCEATSFVSFPGCCWFSPDTDVVDAVSFALDSSFYKPRISSRNHLIRYNLSYRHCERDPLLRQRSQVGRLPSPNLVRCQSASSMTSRPIMLHLQFALPTRAASDWGDCRALPRHSRSRKERKKIDKWQMSELIFWLAFCVR